MRVVVEETVHPGTVDKNVGRTNDPEAPGFSTGITMAVFEIRIAGEGTNWIWYECVRNRLEVRRLGLEVAHE